MQSGHHPGSHCCDGVGAKVSWVFIWGVANIFYFCGLYELLCSYLAMKRLNFRYITLMVLLLWGAVALRAQSVQDFTYSHLGHAEGMLSQRVYFDTPDFGWGLVVAHQTWGRCE